jgi:hypothetical protein
MNEPLSPVLLAGGKQGRLQVCGYADAGITSGWVMSDNGKAFFTQEK